MGIFLYLTDFPALCKPEGPIRKEGLQIYVLHKVKSLLFLKGMKLSFKIAEPVGKQFYSVNIETTSQVVAIRQNYS